MIKKTVDDDSFFAKTSPNNEEETVYALRSYYDESYYASRMDSLYTWAKSVKSEKLNIIA
jgi:pectin methylesterase-like acyl-CoA thioesterase